MAKPVRWQYRHAMKLAWMLVVVAAACTRPNPAVCCLDQADCNEVGISEVRDCSAGLACVEHQCVVPSCAMTGCEVAAPVCNLTTDVCEGCTDSSECSRFPDANVCDTSSGGCVECVAASDCPAAEPVCDASACRACKLDSECASGACGDDGACVGEDSIVYMDPGGVDVGSCTRAAPCRTFAFAIPRTSTTRSHVVLGPGAYVERDIVIDSQMTSAKPLYIHGGGASISLPQGNDGTVFDVAVNAVVRHLQFPEVIGNGLVLSGTEAIVAEDITAHGGYRAISTSGSVTLRDIAVDGATYGIDITSGQVTVERAVIHGGTTAIHSGSNVLVYATNVLIYGTADLAIDLHLASGSIDSSTVAYAGAETGTGPRAVDCASNMTVRSTIIWAPGTTSRVPIVGCNAVNSIAGPTPAAGFMNVDPKFVSPSSSDWHLAPNSPARDVVDAGPMTDFEGDVRPQGARYDIGADEAAP